MNLTIDIGNTTTKAGVFAEDKMICFQRWDGCPLNEIQSLAKEYSTTTCIVSSTRIITDEMRKNLLNACCGQTVFLDHTTPVPVTNKYESPQTLGMDRLAAVVGAYNEMPGKDILIIDSGTAITYDMLTAGGEYLGGNISPGIDMRFRALHEFTAKLPLVSQESDTSDTNSDDNTKTIGKDTLSAIRFGVMEGVKHEIEGFIRYFIHKYPSLLIFLTGGNAFDFEEQIKKRIFADKFLVLKGLNRILNEQIQK